MFKPSIRSVPKTDLRFQIQGWRQRSTGVLYQHRFPLRRAWIQKIAEEPSLIPVLTRNGQVVLLNSKEELATSSSFVKRGLVLVVCLVFAVSFGSISIFSEAVTSKPVAEGQSSLKTSEAKSACSELNTATKKILEQWVADQEEARIKFIEHSSSTIGGIKSQIIEIGCAASSFVLRVSLVKHGDQWVISKFARLEN